MKVWEEDWGHLLQSSISGRTDGFLSSFPSSFLEFASCFTWTCTYINQPWHTITVTHICSHMFSTCGVTYLAIRVTVGLYRTLAAQRPFGGADSCSQLHHSLVEVPGSLGVHQCVGQTPETNKTMKLKTIFNHLKIFLIFCQHPCLILPAEERTYLAAQRKSNSLKFNPTKVPLSLQDSCCQLRWPSGDRAPESDCHPPLPSPRQHISSA